MKVVAFLRGINVGGHHKVPMSELIKKLSECGCSNNKTLLNTGNVIFNTIQTDIKLLEHTIEEYLWQSFGFSIPVILRTFEEIVALVARNPFATINTNKNTRLYVSFSKETIITDITLPYLSHDNSFTILSIDQNTIVSVLDLSISNTPKWMNDLEKIGKKTITTRNRNTIVKLTKL